MINLSVIISMYDEHVAVLTSIKNIKDVFPTAHITIIHSDDKKESTELEDIKQKADFFITLEDLSLKYSRFEYPSYSISRNFSRGFTELYKTEKPFDLIVCFTGDTLITDASNFIRRYGEMLFKDWYAMVSQAIHQNFHSKDADPANGRPGGRIQHYDITDFACCLFFVLGSFAIQSKVFSDIKVVNTFTSEQCLGDELVEKLAGKGFKQKVGILNASNIYSAYDYSDGVVYHSTRNGNPSRE